MSYFLDSAAGEQLPGSGSHSSVSPKGGAPPLKAIAEGKRKFKECMDNDLLDYKRNPIHLIEACTNLLIKIFSNIIESPDEEKFRQIKSSSNSFKINIAAVKGGQRLLTMAGFHTKLIDEIECWCFTPDAAGIKLSILNECREMLLKATRLIQEKAERRKKEIVEKEAREKEARRAIAAQVDEDRKWRQLKSENELDMLRQKEKEMREKESTVRTATREATAVVAAALARLDGRSYCNGEGKEVDRIKKGVGDFFKAADLQETSATRKRKVDVDVDKEEEGEEEEEDDD